MIQIKDKIVSFDIFEKNFCCNLNVCKGNCCVAGDSGAPIEPDEQKAIEEALPHIKNYLSKEAIEIINKNGISYEDNDGDIVTTLNNGKECVFTVFENGIAFCAIEKCFQDSLCSIQKPVSCHLYPIRLKNYKSFTAVNFDSWKICSSAITKGNEVNLPVYKFNKTALIRKFGEEWYKELCIAQEFWLKQVENDKK